MTQPKWKQVAKEALKSKNVSATARKHGITRGTVYKYIALYKALKK